MPAPLRPGSVLRDRYVIQTAIGRGGMGSIYLAEDNRLQGRLCALKEVRQDPDLPAELRAQGREQFYREASVLARLDHPTLPKVSDYFSQDESDFLVMDFIPGDDLKARMDAARKKGRFLDVQEVLAWAAQIVDALAYLHSQTPPVIHRDIKPSNLKLTPRGQIKLVDFGLVKQLVPDEMTVTVIQGRGTALYTPLEQYGGDAGHTDARSDIYAFGATLYHLLTNTPPVEAKARFLSPGSLPEPRTLNPAIPSYVQDAILWAMSLHPDDRPSSIEDLRAMMLAKATRPIAPTPADFWPPPSNPIDRALAIAAAAMLVIAILATFS